MERLEHLDGSTLQETDVEVHLLCMSLRRVLTAIILLTLFAIALNSFLIH